MSQVLRRVRARHHHEDAAQPLLDWDPAFNVDTMLGVRKMEDYLILLGHLSESERMPVPDGLRDEWARTERGAEELANA